MGLVSNDLKNIVDKLGDAKNSINAKYEIMRTNNSISPQPELDHLYINELSPSINKIECINTYGNVKIDSKNILEGIIVFSQGKAITGTMPERGKVNAVLHKDNPVLNLNDGHYENGTVKIQLQEKVITPSTSIQIVEPDNECVLSKVLVEKMPLQQKKEFSLSKAHPKDEAPAGYYEDKITAELTDYDVVYVINDRGQIADVQTVTYGQSFNITNAIPVHSSGALFMGWSKSTLSLYGEYSPGQRISADLANRGDTCILYAVWKENEPPSPPSIAFSYENEGKLQDNGTEVATITITPGIDPEKHSVTNTLICDNAGDKVTLTKISETRYKAVFNDAGIYVFIATTTDTEGMSSSVAGTATILKPDGSFGGQGVFSIVDTSGTFTSNKTDFVAGCYISGITLKITIGNDHGSAEDYVDAYLIKTDGSSEKVRIHTGSFGSKTFEIQKTFTLKDDVRQIYFDIVTPGHAHCINENSTITWNIDYKFDISLWK